MKNVKHLSIVLFMFLGTQFVFSQDISEAPESVKKIAKIGTHRWKNTLILTTKQAEKLLSLTTAYEMKKNEIYKSDVESADELNTKLASLETSHHKAVEAILNPKQIEKFRSKVKLIQG